MEDQPTRHLSRRTVMIGVAGLAGVTAAGGTFIWLKATDFYQLAWAPMANGLPLVLVTIRCKYSRAP